MNNIPELEGTFVEVVGEIDDSTPDETCVGKDVEIVGVALMFICLYKSQ